MSPEQCWEPLPVGQSWTAGTITHCHQVPLAGSLGQGGAHRAAPGDDHHLLVLLLVDELIQSVSAQPTVTLIILISSFQ